MVSNIQEITAVVCVHGWTVGSVGSEDYGQPQHRLVGVSARNDCLIKLPREIESWREIRGTHRRIIQNQLLPI